MLTRRDAFLGLSGVLAMPAIAKASSLMAIRPQRLIYPSDLVVGCMQLFNGTWKVYASDLSLERPGRWSTGHATHEIDAQIRRYCQSKSGWKRDVLSSETVIVVRMID